MCMQDHLYTWTSVYLSQDSVLIGWTLYFSSKEVFPHQCPTEKGWPMGFLQNYPIPVTSRLYSARAWPNLAETSGNQVR